MFGYLGKKGKVYIDDLKSVRLFNEIVDRVVHPHIDRDNGTLVSGKGASIEIEEVAEGSEFNGKIIIRNATQKDVEIINACLRAAEDSGIGGWTRRGRGRVKFDVVLRQQKWSDYKALGEVEAKKWVVKP